MRGDRQGVARKAGQVLLAQRLGHFGRFVVVQCVVTAHQALQFRELPHHVGEQVALAEFCGTIGQGRVAADGCGNRFRQGAHALRLVVLRAELRLERHALQRFDVRGQRLLPVRLVEERGIGQARTHDALVARDHLRRVAALDVGDRDEPGHQLPLCIAHREIPLVLLHRGDQHFGRQFEELRVESSRQRDRPFDQARDLVEQRVVDDGDAIQLRGRGGDAGSNAVAPCIHVRHDLAALEQRPDVRRRARDPERLRCHEAVAVGDVARLLAEDFRLDDVLAPQHQHPVHRTHEQRFAGAPAHALGDRQRIERRRDDGGEQVHGARTGLGATEDEPFTLGRLDLLERRDVDAAATREREGGLRRGTVRIERGLHGRAALFERTVRLLFDELLHAHGQPARGRECLERLVRDAGVLESLGHAFGKRRAQVEQRLGRQFFGADLDQEIAGGAHARPPVGRPFSGSGGSTCKIGEPPLLCSIGNPSASRLA